MDCTVCCEKLNKSTRKEVICNYCDYSSCRICFQKYLIESIDDPHCMNCKKQFNRDFLASSCTSVFISTSFKEYRQDVLFNREKALLIETQPYVVVEREKMKLRDEITLIQREIDKLESAKRVHFNKIHSIQQRILGLNIENSLEVGTQEARKFIRKCPVDNCRGFLSTRWKCGTCDTFICNKCNEVKDEDHECKPENIASMELLNKDTKPCPECATMIFRVSGCPQMWCTNCNTPWDWNTGRKVQGTIHNPHYYEFVRNGGGGGGRNHGDIPCGGLPNVTDIRRMCIDLGIRSDKLYNIHNVITHIEHYELRQHPIGDIVSHNRKLRIEYLLDNIDEDLFKKTLQLNEKSREKYRDFNNIYQMFINVASDILRQMVLSYREKNHKEAQEFLDEQMTILLNLAQYFNDQIKKIGKSYKVVYPGISLPEFRFQNNYETYLARKLVAEQVVTN